MLFNRTHTIWRALSFSPLPPPSLLTPSLPPPLFSLAHTHTQRNLGKLAEVKSKRLERGDMTRYLLSTTSSTSNISHLNGAYFYSSSTGERGEMGMGMGRGDILALSDGGGGGGGGEAR